MRKQLVMAIAMAVLGMSTANAQDAGGLGKRWPNAADQSRIPSFHAYRFDRDGIAYVQVNAQDGSPLLALAAGNGVILKLPVGIPDAVIVTDAATAQAAAGTVVYVDGGVQVLSTSSGYLVAPVAAAGCNDPVECTRPQLVAPASTSPQNKISTMATCTDPVECTRINAN